MTSKSIDRARVDPENIDDFYTLFESVKRDFEVLPENIFNMDEHGLGLGICTNQRIIAVSNKSSTYPKTPEDSEKVSICRENKCRLSKV